jgi:hypothetical protein
VAIKHSPDGSVYLSPYKNYSPKEIDQYTRFGKYGPPTNNLANLTTVDGKPINLNDFPTVNVASPGIKAPDSTEAISNKSPEAAPNTPDAQPQLAGGAKPVDGPVVPKTDAPAPASDGISALGKMAKYIAPLALTIGPIVDGASGGYHAYEKSGSALDAVGGAVEGAGNGRPVDRAVAG